MPSLLTWMVARGSFGKKQQQQQNEKKNKLVLSHLYLCLHRIIDMGCFGIGVSRVLACAVEASHDKYAHLKMSAVYCSSFVDFSLPFAETALCGRKKLLLTRSASLQQTPRLQVRCHVGSFDVDLKFGLV